MDEYYSHCPSCGQKLFATGGHACSTTAKQPAPNALSLGASAQFIDNLDAIHAQHYRDGLAAIAVAAIGDNPDREKAEWALRFFSASDADRGSAERTAKVLAAVDAMGDPTMLLLKAAVLKVVASGQKHLSLEMAARLQRDYEALAYALEPSQQAPPVADSITPAQRDLLRHALGIDRGTEAFRNHFQAGPGHSDYANLLALVESGHMTRRPYPLAGEGEEIFHTTPLGREAADGSSGA